MRRTTAILCVLALAACEPDDGAFFWDGVTQDTAGGDWGLDSGYDTSAGEMPDMAHIDNDADGYTPADGDCDDSEFGVNPGAYDDPDNGVDDDCDGVMDNPVASCDCGATPTLVEGMELCDPRFLLSVSTVSHAPDAGLGRGVRTHYGSAGNGLDVRMGCAYSILDTGRIDPIVDIGDNRQPGTDFYESTVLECPGTEPDPDPAGGPGSIEICDTEQLVIRFKAPTNASGFSFDFIYLSTEYPEWVGLGYNDTFYAIIERASGPRQNISFDDYDNEIEVDNAFFEDPPVTDLAGSGYSDVCYGILGTAEICGSSTGWLRTSWNIDPGEEFTLTFSIHDEGDGIYDSMVIIDNFQWSLEAVDPGTVII